MKSIFLNLKKKKIAHTDAKDGAQWTRTKLFILCQVWCGIKPVQKDILQTFYGMADISRKFLFFLSQF